MRRGQHSKRKRHYQTHINDEEGIQQGHEHRLQARQRAVAVLHIQAHEADVVHGAVAKARAQSLEIGSTGKPSAQTSLIKLRPGPDANAGGFWDDTSVFTLGSGSSPPKSGVNITTVFSKREAWVDRYDARLLLESFTDLNFNDDPDTFAEAVSPTSSSWSDFPEDSCETFLLSQSQAEDYHRAKRRRLLDEAYEMRLKEREAEDKETEDEEAAIRNGEPSPEALLLMHRTANHLLSASNPAQLEMRILANHGADQRFSFLRQGGKWNNTWLEIQGKLAAEKEKERLREHEAGAVANVHGKGLGGLTGYGSDSDGSDDANVTSAVAVAPDESMMKGPTPEPPPTSPPPLPVGSDPGPLPRESPDSDKLKEERRARARQWMLSRKGLND